MTSYFLYARKSTESEDRQSLSIDAQVDELKRYADKRGLNIAETFTESKSAKRSGRPIFNAMLKSLKSKKVAGILCWKLDRLSRNLADAALLTEAMDDGLLNEIHTQSQVFKNTSTDRFMSGMEWLVGRKYIDDLSENVKRGTRIKIERGWFPGQAPLGYLNDRNHPQGQRKIINDQEKFDLVRRLWDLMLTGQYSVPMILEIANDKLGLTTRKGRYPSGRPLSRSGLYRIFTNVFYCGQFEYNGELHDGKHEPMVTIDEFDRVQLLLGGKGRPRPKERRFTFTGLIGCGQCGGSVTAEEKFKDIKSTGARRRYVYYHCSHNKKSPCRQRSITENELERQIEEHLARLTIPKEYLDFAFKYLDQLKQSENRTKEQAVDSFKRELETVQRRLQNLLAMKISPENENGELLSDVEYLKQKNELLRKQNRLKTNLSTGACDNEKVAVLTRETFEFATYARLWFSNGSPEKQRTILSEVGSNRTLIDGELRITAKKPLAVIERQLSRMNGDSGRVEPKIDTVNTDLKYAGVGQDARWCTLVTDVRTEIRKSLESNAVYSGVS